MKISRRKTIYWDKEVQNIKMMKWVKNLTLLDKVKVMSEVCSQHFVIFPPQVLLKKRSSHYSSILPGPGPGSGPGSDPPLVSAVVLWCFIPSRLAAFWILNVSDVLLLLRLLLGLSWLLCKFFSDWSVLYFMDTEVLLITPVTPSSSCSCSWFQHSPSISPWTFPAGSRVEFKSLSGISGNFRIPCIKTVTMFGLLWKFEGYMYKKGLGLFWERGG